MNIKPIAKFPDYSVAASNESSERGRHESEKRQEKKRQNNASVSRAENGSIQQDDLDGSLVPSQILDSVHVIDLLSKKVFVPFEKVRNLFKSRLPKKAVPPKIDRSS